MPAPVSCAEPACSVRPAPHPAAGITLSRWGTACSAGSEPAISRWIASSCGWKRPMKWRSRWRRRPCMTATPSPRSLTGTACAASSTTSRRKARSPAISSPALMKRRGSPGGSPGGTPAFPAPRIRRAGIFPAPCSFRPTRWTAPPASIRKGKQPFTRLSGRSRRRRAVPVKCSRAS